MLKNIIGNSKCSSKLINIVDKNDNRKFFEIVAFLLLLNKFKIVSLDIELYTGIISILSLFCIIQ